MDRFPGGIRFNSKSGKRKDSPEKKGYFLTKRIFNLWWYPHNIGKNLQANRELGRKFKIP